MREPGEAQLARRVELAQQVRERHRVGPARQRDDHARPGAGQIVAADRAPDAVEQHHRLERREGLEGWTADGPVRLSCRSRPSCLITVRSWCRRTDSNRRPRAYETRALTN